MNILYIGEDKVSSNSFYLAKALNRIGNKVVVRNPYLVKNKGFRNPLLEKFHYITGYFLLQKKLNIWIQKILTENKEYNLIWVNSGELLSSSSLKLLKTYGCPVILYSNDDPTGKRDRNRFKSLLKAIKYYDLCIIRKEKENRDFEFYGVKNILKVFMSYDEIEHKPYNAISGIDFKFYSDIVFVGTWIRGENRDKFILELIKSGLSISIWGDRWEKSPYWSYLKKNYLGKALYGREYVAAIQGSKICLGFLSKGNGDMHTRRSVEIPFIGGVLCAERTSIHQEMYKDGVEAVFWNDAEECAVICKKLLTDDILRNSIRIAGMKKVRELKVGNEDICKQIIASLNE
jgi:hypothetical protein